jgi:hypothetical protein
MRARRRALALATAAVLGGNGMALGGQTSAHEGGDSLYRRYCAICHGDSGRGDGRLAESLRYRPSDLGLLAQRSDGKFPRDDVFKAIDGRKPVKGHGGIGGTDMPMWGDAFKNATEGFSEDAVKVKIEALVDHLEGLQVKREK